MMMKEWACPCELVHRIVQNLQDKKRKDHCDEYVYAFIHLQVLQQSIIYVILHWRDLFIDSMKNNLNSYLEKPRTNRFDPFCSNDLIIARTSRSRSSRQTQGWVWLASEDDFSFCYDTMRDQRTMMNTLFLDVIASTCSTKRRNEWDRHTGRQTDEEEEKANLVPSLSLSLTHSGAHFRSALITVDKHLFFLNYFHFLWLEEILDAERISFATDVIIQSGQTLRLFPLLLKVFAPIILWSTKNNILHLIIFDQ